MAQRTVVITIFNSTEFLLNKTYETMDHGLWTANPPEQIPPNSSAQCAAESSGFATGAEGEFIYSIVGTPASYRVHFDNPYVGSNSADGYLQGQGTERFTVGVHGHPGVSMKVEAALNQKK